MIHETHELRITTRGQGLYEFTQQVEAWLRRFSLKKGILTVFVKHTSASLLIQENADPDVVLDLTAFFSKLVAEDPRLYRHTIEGADDMPAHIRAALTATQLAIPIHDGHLSLGTWQGIYLFEHRRMGHMRTVVLHLLGE